MPADEEHHYGHGKVESISALAETALLFVLSGFVVWEAGHRLVAADGHAIEVSIIAFAVVAGSIVIDFLRARALTRVATETASEALEADALHFSSDMWSSAAVFIGLGGVALGYPWMDSVAAIVVAVFICVAGWRLGKRTIDTLTDTAPSGVTERIRKAVIDATRRGRDRSHPGAEGRSDRCSSNSPSARAAACRSTASPRSRPTSSAGCTTRSATAEVSVTVDPRALDNETVTERVMVIARNRALAVHHVTVHAIADKLSVSLDLEVDGNLALSAAHEIASGLEAAVKDELGPEVEVETHIEPLQVNALAGGTTPMHCARNGSRRCAVRTRRQAGFVQDIHDVRVRDTADGEIVNFHGYADAGASVHDVHEKVDEIERGLRRRFPAIKRVIGHAEPRAELRHFAADFAFELRQRSYFAPHGGRAIHRRAWRRCRGRRRPAARCAS